jgi:glucose-6-phosphate 1-dehydrogenase
MTTALLAPPLDPVEAAGCDLVVLGATGDLSRRKLLPALAESEARGVLPAGTRVIGVGRQALSDEAFRAQAEASLHKHAGSRGGSITDRVSYVRADLGAGATGFADLARALPRGTGRTRVFYLACAPDLFAPVCHGLGAAGLVDDRSRLVMEKPLGTDLRSAREISDQVAEVFTERQVFRIDHYLGKETVQNLLVLRFANTVLGPVWDSRSVDHVQITLSEDLGVGGRGGYYDRAGAVRDMVQNHLLQLLCLVAMEPPDKLDADGIRDAKVQVLRALRPWTHERAATHSVRGQYATNGGLPGYLEDCGNTMSMTESFAALRVDVDSWRWAGVPFYLRTGKRLDRHHSEIVVQFKDVPHWIFPDSDERPIRNRLVIGLQPNEVVHLELRAKQPGPGRVQLASRPLRLDLSAAFSGRPAEAYERLLLDVLNDDPVLFMRRDEVEAAWAWIDPLIAAWRAGATPLVDYPAGGTGPERAHELLRRDGRQWHT